MRQIFKNNNKVKIIYQSGNPVKTIYVDDDSSPQTEVRLFSSDGYSLVDSNGVKLLTVE